MRPLYRFQGYYAYRNDGATLLDVFRLDQGQRPQMRLICSALHNRLEMLDSSPDGRTIWLPATGKSEIYSELVNGKRSYKKDPVCLESCTILINTAKFNQGLSDGFFSVRKHALVANDEDLRKLQRELRARAQAAGQERAGRPREPSKAA